MLTEDNNLKIIIILFSTFIKSELIFLYSAMARIAEIPLE